MRAETGSTSEQESYEPQRADPRLRAAQAVPLVAAAVFVLVVRPEEVRPWRLVAWVVLAAFVLLRLYLWMPRRVTLDDAGVTLVARARIVRIPWADLESIAAQSRSPRFVRWTRRGGAPVVMRTNLANLHRLLLAVERHAPHAQVGEAEPAPSTAAGTDCYRLAGPQHRTMQAVAALLVAGGLVGLAVNAWNGDAGPAALVTLWLAIIVIFPARLAYWTPARAEVDEGGVTLVAPLRRVRIAWTELASVGPPWWDAAGFLRWTTHDGVGVTTERWPDTLHRLLATVERRAPGADVSS